MMKSNLEDIKNFMNLIFSKGCEGQSEVDHIITELIENLDTTTRISSDESLDELTFLADSITIPDNHIEPYEYFENYIKEIVAHTVNTASPNYIGHMTSALPNFIRPLNRLIVALNQNVVKTETSKFFTLQERSTIAMLHELVYKNNEQFYKSHCHNYESTLGIATSGGTIANLTALWIARNNTFNKIGVDIVKEGIAFAMNKSGYRRAVIIASALIHYSIEKSIDLLGIGSDCLIKVNVNEKGQIDTRELRKVIKKCKENGYLILAIIGIGGATETGAVDSLEEIGYISQENGIHFHVDAAWGGPILMSKKYNDILKGIELSDTVTIDGHKQLYVPMGLGIMLCRDPIIAKCIEKQAPYIIRSNSCDLGKRTIEGSRPASTFSLHAALTILGKDGYSFLIDEGISKARYMSKIINELDDFELIGESQINIINYRYIPSFYREKVKNGKLSKEQLHVINKFNEKIQDIQSKKGDSFVSRTKLTCYKKYNFPITVLRAVIANPLTTEENITSVIYQQLDIGQELENEIMINNDKFIM